MGIERVIITVAEPRITYSPMAVTADDLRVIAYQLLDSLDVYDRFVEGWPYEHDAVPNEIVAYLVELDGSTSGAETSPGVALATGVTEQYHEAREAEAMYVQRVRERGRPDWSRIVAETEPVRQAARRVHTAGYGIDPETGEPGYLLPRELCPARLVSMNGGSSPVTFEDRVTQYVAFADRFDVSPDVVYYPGSGHDVSLSEAFPESRVIYADVDEAAMSDLDRAGYEAVGTDAAAYELGEEADVILFRNAGLMEEPIVETNLRAGGWVLANDHLESARHLARMDSLELVGVVPDTWTGDFPTVNTEDLGAYLSRLDPGAEDWKQESDEPPLEKGTPLDVYVFRAHR
jgi:hypothetical protein